MLSQFRRMMGLLSCLTVSILILQAPALGDQLTVHASREAVGTDTETGAWSVRLKFNHPVFPSNLAGSTTVTADGAAIKFDVIVPSSREKASEAGREFLLFPVDPETKSGSITIVVKQGLSDAVGRRSLAKDYIHRFAWALPITLTDVGTFSRSKTDKGLSFSVSGSVSQRDLGRALTVNPAVRRLTVSRESDRQFRITGDFEYDRDYVLKVSPLSVDKGRAEFVAQEFAFKGPGVKPEISFKSDRSVVELTGRQLLPLIFSNVSKVRCTLTRIPPALIPEASEALRSGEGMQKLRLDERASSFTSLIAASKLSPVFISPDSVDSDVFFAPEAKANVFNYSMPLSFRKNPDQGGAWLASLTDPDGDFKGESIRLIQVTDLSVTYKISGKSLLLWVTSLYTGQPLSDVHLLLVSGDGSFVSVGKTSSDGLVLVKDGNRFVTIRGSEAAQRPIDVGSVRWVIAATKNDSCAIEVSSLRLKPFTVQQTAQIKEKPDSRTGYVFTERGVYRPGETVHFKFVSRAYENNRVSAPAGEKVKIEIIGPREDVNYSKELTLNEFGSCWDSQHVEKYYPVGTYTISVKSLLRKDNAYTFTGTFMVQEFKRQRHYATLSVKREQRSASDFVGVKVGEAYLIVEVKGQYYVGGPVKNGRVRWRANLIPATNVVRGFDAFFFGNEDDKTLFLESGESTLDAEGRLRFAVPLDSRLLTGIYAVEISATVLDIDGEPATEVEKYNPMPRFLVGIGEHPRKVQTGYSAPLRLMVVDENGKPVSSGKVDAAIMEKKSFYVEKRDTEGNLNSLWEDGWLKTLGSQIPLNHGEGTFQLDLNDSGDYLIAFTYEAEGSKYTSQAVFKVGWEEYDRWSRNQRDQDVRTFNEVLVSMSKKEYGVGENVRVQFNTARPVKKCLVTLEKDDILDYKVIEVKAGDGGYQFPVKEEYLPNIYFSVIAAVGREGFPVYSNQADSEIPTVYFGYADISVRSEIKRLSLAIDPGIADLKARPAEKKTISLKVTDQSGKGIATEMAVCVVDEGVLALTRYKTPDLSGLTKFNLPLAVFSGDLHLDLVSQDLFRRLSTRPLTGGGLGVGELSPALRKDFRPVAYYNPAVLTDKEGHARVEFQLPDTNTSYRVFAVVCDKGPGFVSGERRMVVNKEFFVEPSVPRFLVPGDKVTFPVVLHNRTAEKGTATVRAESGPGLNIRVEDASRRIEPWSSAVAKVFAEVTGGVDRGVLRFHGRFSGEPNSYEDSIEQTFPVHSRYLPINRVKLGDFTEKVDIKTDLPDALKNLTPIEMNPTDFTAYLSLGVTNWAKLGPGLRYLLAYPYGCIEQTSSGIIPLAGMRGLVESGLLPGLKIEDVDKFLKSGVERLLSMQLVSGGFSYWPGQIDDSWWGTMYAVFALHTARQAGVPVPQDRMDKALKFVRENLFATNGDRFQGSQWTRELAVFNLSLAGMISPQELNTFFDNYGSLNDQAKALLIMSAKKTGLLPDAKLKEMVKRMEPRLDANRKDYYDTSFREIAVCLMAAVEIGGSPQKADAWAGYLLRGLQPQGRWVSTADTGWCLLALQQYFRGQPSKASDKTKVKVSYGGHSPTEVSVSDTTAYLELDAGMLLEHGSIRIEADSKRLITYTLNLTYPDLVHAPGHLSRGFTLRKKMENLNGSDEIRLGDVIRMTLEIGLIDPDKSRQRDLFEYLALEDPVPAGIVPINSELKTEGAQEEDPSARTFGSDMDDFTPTYFEFRDDGVRVFKNSAWSGSFRYSYLARAVAEGEFWMIGSRISLMYDPDCYGRTEGRKVRILPTAR